MSASHRFVEIRAHGSPREVLHLNERTRMALPEGYVRLEMAYAPINPADLNYAEGVYGLKPTLPATIGNEGCGIVIETGDAGVALGTPVILLGGLQTWAEELVVPVSEVLAVPKNLALDQAAQLRVNPLTAWALLESYCALQAGDWVVQNAGNSAVGLSVIQLCKLRKINLLSMVRSEAAAQLCYTHGAEPGTVHLDGQAPADLLAAMQGQKAKLALNAVGGDSALRLASLLADRSFHVTYGAMGRQKLSLPNRFLIFQELQFVGFWLTKWLERTPKAAVRATYALLADHMAEGSLKLPIAATFSLEQLGDAVDAAAQSQRNGKVLLRLNAALP